MKKILALGKMQIIIHMVFSRIIMEIDIMNRNITESINFIYNTGYI